MAGGRTLIPKNAFGWPNLAEFASRPHPAAFGGWHKCRFRAWGFAWSATSQIAPFSGDRRKRVLNAKSGNLLPGVQIFREETRRAALGRGGDDKRIPETDLRFIFDTECHRKLSWGRFYAPDGVTADHQAGRILWQRRANLAGYVHVKFLQDLHAQNTGPFAP